MITFAAKKIYSALNGVPVLEFATAGVGGGLDVKGAEAGDGAGGRKPEVAVDKVSLLRTVFVRAPNVDTNCAVATLAGGLDERVHFFRYSLACTGVGGVDNVTGVVHVCYDHLGDNSSGYTSGNLDIAESDYEAADLSRAIRTVFPTANPADQSSAAQALSAVADRSEKYTGLWCRLLALGDAMDAGLGLAPGVGNAAAAQVQVAGPAIGGGAGRAVNALPALIHTAASGGDGVTFLPVEVARREYTDGVLRALTAVGLANCGVTLGPTLRSSAALFPDVHHVLVYGNVSAMRANAFGAAAAVTVADVNEALRWLMATTGDESGLNEAIGWLARRVRFFGPKITNLPTSMDARFHNLNPAIMLHLRAFYEAYKWDKTGVNEPELNAALNALRAGGNVAKRARDDTLGVWGAADGDYRRIGESMCNCSDLDSYLSGLTTSEMTVLWSKIANWNKRIDDAAAPGAGIIDIANTLNVGAADFTLPAALIAPQWNRVKVDESVSADGHSVKCMLPTCGGINDLKLAIGGKLNSAVATRGTKQVLTSLCSGPAFRRRLYLLATAVRCATDVVMDILDSSYEHEMYAQGIFNTGNAALDTALAYTVADYASSSIDGEELLAAVLNECAYYGLCHPEGSKDIDTFSYGVETNAFPDQCVRCCFHPSVAKQFLGDDCGRSGGDYDFDDALVALLSKPTVEPWAFHKLDGMRSSEVAALCQFLGASKGSNLLFAQYVQHVEADLGGRESQVVNFMPTAVCRPTENRVDLSLMTPTLWWYRPALPGYLKLLGTGNQLRAGYNIVDGLRDESQPNVSTAALQVLYDGNAAVYTCPVRGEGRTRWIMRGNAMAAPAAAAPVVAGMPRVLALDWFSQLVGSINRVAATSRNVSCVRLTISRATRLPTGTLGLTVERVRAITRNDAHGAVFLSAGMKRLLAFDELPAATVVKGSDF
jgi:hypothetical protein